MTRTCGYCALQLLRRVGIAGADRALLRNRRVNPMIEKAHQLLNYVRTNAGVPQGERVGAEQHDRPCCFRVKGCPDSGGMTGDDVFLKPLRLVWIIHVVRFMFAEPGRHSVHHLLLSLQLECRRISLFRRFGFKPVKCLPDVLIEFLPSVRESRAGFIG